METLMFYSYKGGAGRSVASANIASALAKMGKRVLIIDIDFEAPGLHAIFEVEDTRKFRSQQGIQEYLNGDTPLEKVRETMVIDMSNEEGLITEFDIPKGGCLKYLFASPQASDVFSDISDVEENMSILLKHLKKKEKLDYVILDAASGIREAFTLSLSSCDTAMVLFRWSEQHFAGTQRILNLLEGMKKLPGKTLYKPYHLIASAVPSDRDLESVSATTKKVLLQNKEDKVQLLKSKYGESGELYYQIPEIVELKWSESVIVFNRNNTPYEEIAQKIIDKTEAGEKKDEDK